MNFLKNIAQKAPEKDLRYYLHKHLARKIPPRSIKVIHASDLVDEERGEFCPREFALLEKTKKQQKDQFLSTSLSVTFKIGRDLEAAIINWFAEMGFARGVWECIVCKSASAWGERPVGCDHCGCKRFDYAETRMKSDVCGASCGIDVLVQLPGANQLRIVELKTIDKEEFKKLAAPLFQHRLRTNLYMRLVDESSDKLTADLINKERASILYVSKGGFGCAAPEIADWDFSDAKFSPFKTFEIERNDATTEKFVAKAKRLYEHRQGKIQMPGRICPTSFCKRAQYCRVVQECFSGAFPSSVEVYPP